MHCPCNTTPCTCYPPAPAYGAPPAPGNFGPYDWAAPRVEVRELPAVGSLATMLTAPRMRVGQLPNLFPPGGFQLPKGQDQWWQIIVNFPIIGRQHAAWAWTDVYRIAAMVDYLKSKGEPIEAYDLNKQPPPTLQQLFPGVPLPF